MAPFCACAPICGKPQDLLKKVREIYLPWVHIKIQKQIITAIYKKST
jgi:hypothetical protein